ncbi:MAG: HipA N-terminal domain-containing protein, partial [Akkermansia sp.]|nr:HipA N-terminal domain-containing protein [Akkermansia sp.]
MEQLHVYLRGERVGTLMSDKGRLFFEYEPAYLQSPGATALAYTMPLREQPYAGGEVVSFFSNLLPDESVRVKLAQYLGI